MKSWRSMFAASAMGVGAACVVGCDRTHVTDCPAAEVRTLEPSDRLFTAPDSIVVDGRVYRLSVYAWRDFMPVTDPDGEPLRVAAWLTAADSNAVPDSLSITGLVVVYTNRAWITDATTRTIDGRTEAFAECGPRWGPGVEVDVIAEVGAGAPERALVARRVITVARTD